MLEVKNLTLGYRDKKREHRVLEDFHFSMEKGSFLGILGPSGCGKTTLLNSLATVLPALEGEILLEGRAIMAKEVSIGLIPQSYGLLPWKTVEENGLLGLFLRDKKDFMKNKESYHQSLLALAERLSIKELLSRYPSSLSGGQAQRTALLRVLLMKPELLLMDEPFAALDAVASISASSLCLDIWREYRPTTVMVTHRLEDAVFLATDILVMGEDGRRKACFKNPWQGQRDCREEGCFQLLSSLRQEITRACHREGEERAQ